MVDILYKTCLEDYDGGGRTQEAGSRGTNLDTSELQILQMTSCSGKVQGEEAPNVAGLSAVSPWRAHASLLFPLPTAAFCNGCY